MWDVKNSTNWTAILQQLTSVYHFDKWKDISEYLQKYQYSIQAMQSPIKMNERHMQSNKEGKKRTLITCRNTENINNFI
jgi:hypothetical protein